MALPDKLLYVSHNFIFKDETAANAEIQIFGLWCQKIHEDTRLPVDPVFEDLQMVADAARDSWISTFGSHADLWSSRIVGNFIKVSQMDTAGHVTAQATSLFTAPQTWAGSGDASVPAQCSIVVGLYGYPPETFSPSRSRKRGRIYLPTPSVSALRGDGTVKATTQLALMNAAALWLSGIRAVVFTDSATFPEPVVASRTGNMATPIQAVGVGLVVDTQRRRRSALPENRTFAISV